MAASCAGLDPEVERRLIKNWTFLKNELMVDTFLDEFIDARIFSESTQREIRHVQPNTRRMRADKFLHSMIRTGYYAYELFCDIIRRDSNRYKEVMDVLGIEQPASDNEGKHLCFGFIITKTNKCHASGALKYFGVYTCTPIT